MQHPIPRKQSFSEVRYKLHMLKISQDTNKGLFLRNETLEHNAMQPNAVFSSPAIAEQWQLIGQPKSSFGPCITPADAFPGKCNTSWLASAMHCGENLGGKYFKNTSHIIT